MIFNSSISWWMIKMHSRNFWSDILTGVVLLVRITSGPRLHHSAPGQTPGSLSSWLMSSPRPHPLHGHSHVFICSALLHSAVLQWNTAVYQLTAVLDEGRDSDSFNTGGWGQTQGLSRNCDTSKIRVFRVVLFSTKMNQGFLRRGVTFYEALLCHVDILLMTNLAPKCSSQKIDKILVT